MHKPLCSAGPGSETMVLLYYSIFYVHAQTFMLSRTWIRNNALLMNRCKIILYEHLQTFILCRIWILNNAFLPKRCKMGLQKAIYFLRSIVQLCNLLVPNFHLLVEFCKNLALLYIINHFSGALFSYIDIVR